MDYMGLSNYGLRSKSESLEFETSELLEINPPPGHYSESPIILEDNLIEASL